MHNNVKLAVDNGDTLSLKYTFCDCLDGDPTFEKYQEDYDYCVRNNALFEAHRELHPMVTSHVDEEYWVQLKNDFMENPSKERLAHMREVAKILYSDRIARIQAERDAAAERAAKAQRVAEEAKKKADEEAKRIVEAQAAQQNTSQPDFTQPQQPAYHQPDSAQTPSGENSRVRRVSERRPGQPNPSAQPGTPHNQAAKSPHPSNGNSPKKASGAGCIIPLLVLAAIVIIVVLIVKNQ